MQILAVCLVDDCIEYGGASAQKYIQQMIPLFLSNMDSDNNVLRQCSTYGIAQSLRFAPTICAPSLSTLVPKLMAFVTNPASQEEENEGARENAVYALGTVYHNRQYRTVSWGGVEPSQLTSLWLQSLPLRADEQEAKTANSQLCDMVENGDLNVAGENYGNLAHLLRIISDVFLDPSVSSSTSNQSNSMAHFSTLERMKTIVRQVVSTGGLSQEVIARSMQSLSLVQQQALQQVI